MIDFEKALQGGWGVAFSIAAGFALWLLVADAPLLATGAAFIAAGGMLMAAVSKAERS